MSGPISENDLQTLWDQQPTQLNIPDLEELIVSLQEEHRQEQRMLLRLNLQEVIPAGGLFLYWGWQGLNATSNAWAHFGASLISLAVAAFIVGSSLRQRAAERKLGTSARDELERSRMQMEHRARLYRTIGWWYVAPVAIAVALSSIAVGLDPTAPATGIFFAIAVAFGGWVYRINRKIGRENYEPKVADLTRLLRDLDTA